MVALLQHWLTLVTTLKLVWIIIIANQLHFRAFVVLKINFLWTLGGYPKSPLSSRNSTLLPSAEAPAGPSSFRLRTVLTPTPSPSASSPSFVTAAAPTSPPFA